MAHNPVVTQYDDAGYPVSPTTSTAIPAGTAAVTVVKPSPGRLARVLVTTTGTAAALVYDNASAASGTIIGAIPANAAVGSSYIFDAPAAAGITVGGNAALPGLTVLWS